MRACLNLTGPLAQWLHVKHVLECTAGRCKATILSSLSQTTNKTRTNSPRQTAEVCVHESVLEPYRSIGAVASPKARFRMRSG